MLQHFITQLHSDKLTFALQAISAITSQIMKCIKVKALFNLTFLYNYHNFYLPRTVVLEPECM